MKQFLYLAALLLCASPSIAAGERPLSVQGTIRGPGGVPFSGNQTVVFSIYNVSTAGTALWTETQSVAFTNGIYSATLGSTTPIPDSVFSTAENLYLGVQIDGNSEFLPRQLLASAPYARFANQADTATTATYAATAGAATTAGSANTAVIASNVQQPTSILTGNITNASTAASTTYFPPTGLYAGTDPESSVPFPATTLGKLKVAVNAAPGSGNSINITIMQDGVVTGCGCTISGTATTCVSNTSVNVSDGDLISIRYLKTTTAAALQRVKFSFQAY